MFKRFIPFLALLPLLGLSVAHADLIKQSTAYTRTVLMTQSADHITGATGLTLTVSESKAGAAFATITPTSVTELSGGRYAITLTTTQTNTLGALDLTVTGTGADPSDTHDQVLVDLPGGSVASVTGNVGGNVVGSVASVTAPVTLPSTAPTGYGGQTGNVTVGGYATGQDPATLLASPLAAVPAATASAILAKSLTGTGLTVGQLMVLQGLTDVKIGGITNAWNAGSHVLTTVYKTAGGTTLLTTTATYPSTQTTNPALLTVTGAAGTVPQP